MEKYCIYFEPKEVKQTELLKQIGTSLPYRDITTFIETYSEQNTPVDFYFIRLDSKPSEVYPVQAKRFGMKVDPKDVTQELMKNLEKWRGKYSPSETTLLIHYQNPGEVSIPELSSWFEKNKFPFKEVILQTIGSQMELKLCQIYPTGGEVNMLEFSGEQVLSV